MNSNAIYRIEETLRVLLFMALAILSIAYDNVHYTDKPEEWNMRMVLAEERVGMLGRRPLRRENHERQTTTTTV